MNDLFGFVPPPPAPRVQKKRKDPTPSGYAGTPGKGPVGETCGTCCHHAKRELVKTYHKCKLNKANWTGGRKTDILVMSPACEKWSDEQ